MCIRDSLCFFLVKKTHNTCAKPQGCLLYTSKRMQKAGYLEKEVDEYNLRRNKLHVTPQGRQLAADCKDAFDALDRESFKGFTEEELETFAGYLDRVAMNMGGGRRLSYEEILDLQRQKEDEEYGH